jgi:hypothetical protein
MKFFAALVVVLIVMLTVLSFVASSIGGYLEYGDTTSGIIKAGASEWAYEFEGEVGDIVLAEVHMQESDTPVSLDLYIIQPDDSRYWGNNFYFDDHVGVLVILDTAGRYTLVGERQGRRPLTGETGFEISLNRLEPEQLDSSWQGTLNNETFNAAHFFYAAADGVYRISMGQEGQPNPALQVMAFGPGPTDYSEVGKIEIATRNEVSMELELQGGIVHVIHLYHSYYGSQATTIPYQVSVAPVREPNSSAQR